MTAPRLTPAAQAHQVVAAALGYRPALEAVLADLPAVRIAAMLVALEVAFEIELDADDALRAGTFAGLLDLVELRLAVAHLQAPFQGVTIYDFTAIRAAIGRPVRPPPPRSGPVTGPPAASVSSFAMDVPPFSVIGAPDYLAPNLVRNPAPEAPDAGEAADPGEDERPPRERRGPPTWRRCAVFMLQIFILGFALKIARACIASALGWPQ
jgi:hypothetical protein